MAADEPFWLRVSAPFAAFRPMQAGAYRTTLPTIPHSAALGLVLNLAGIEMRDSKPGATTAIRSDVPRMRIAVGALTDPEFPKVSSLYQQLHSYPVGASGKELKAKAHGNKFWIAPARRELLVDFDAVIGVRDAPPGLRERVAKGLRGELGEPRYGLPFAGDNDHLFDRLELLASPPEAHWYVPLQDGQPAQRGICRLTIGIDRRDASRTTTMLFVPMLEKESAPALCWIWTPRAESTT